MMLIVVLMIPYDEDDVDRNPAACFVGGPACILNAEAPRCVAASVFVLLFFYLVPPSIRVSRSTYRRSILSS